MDVRVKFGDSMLIYQSFKTRDAQASLGTPTDPTAVMVAHRRLYTAMRNNDDIDWPVPSLMLSFHDLVAGDVISGTAAESVGMAFWPCWRFA